MTEERIRAVVSRDDFKLLRPRAQVATLLLLLNKGPRKLPIKSVAVTAGMSYRTARRAVQEARTAIPDIGT
jgi:molybdenum-dependent DNA-binding transcriptional regulator ModE